MVSRDVGETLSARSFPMHLDFLDGILLRAEEEAPPLHSLQLPVLLSKAGNTL